LTFLLAEAALEERAEDDGLDFGPIFLGGFEQQANFTRLQFDGFDGGEEAAVEVVHAREASAAGALRFVHLAEQAAKQIVTVGTAATFLQQPGKEALGEQADILGEHGDDALENESTGSGTVLAAVDQGVEGTGDILGGLSGDLDPVVPENRRKLTREQKVQSGMPLDEFADLDSVHRLVEMSVEIVNPELVEVTKGDEWRSVGNQVEPVVESFLVPRGELHAARLHLDETAAGPEEVGVFGSLAWEPDVILEAGTLGECMTLMAECFQQPDEEQLRLGLLVAFETGS